MKKINVIVDASGSMGEDDKNAVVKYLLNGISNVACNHSFNVSFSLFQWGVETKPIDYLEKAKIRFAGCSNVKGLESLSSWINNLEPIILISDGNYELEVQKKIKNLSNKIIPIFVGLDANRSILQDISFNKRVYSVVDFVQAILDS